MKGTFVIIEGGDCSGKSTFVRFLKDKYPDVCFTNEPGGNQYGMKIRELLLDAEGAEESDNMTKFHLYWASKAENFRKVVLPNLFAGKDVVSDRFEGSTYAYQVSEDPALEDLFWKTRDVCLAGVTPVYMHFDVPVEVAIQRAKARAGESNYFDTRGVEYRNKVRNAYLKFFTDPRIESYLVDTSLLKQEMLRSADQIFKAILGF